MKLVILAGGKGKRMGESSSHTPKPLLLYKNKNLIQHKIDALPDTFEEIIIVIGHLGEKIIETFGNSCTLSSGKSVPIKYVWQKELLGTAHALHQAKDQIGNSAFVVLMGDDLYNGEDIFKIIKHHNNTGEWSVLLEKCETHIPYGKCIVDDQGYMRELADDPDRKIESNNMYTGACLLTPDFFEIPMTKYVHSFEYGLPYTFIVIAKDKNIKSFYTTKWKRITTPGDLNS
jgi:NDP-sugar pyrophosphorylase family protein